MEAAIGGRARVDAIVAHAEVLVEVLGELARLGRAEEDGGAERDLDAVAELDGRLHFAGAFEREQARAGGKHRLRQAIGAARADAIQPPPWQVTMRAVGRRVACSAKKSAGDSDRPA